ncbi:esterase family protein [Rhodococcus sp. D2-41]|uniref:alpha/beta hydrolase n=1 Tax=Speluncibacter jeojiensis TaxID=2710754 RepID=UPI00240F6553|nr:alpha/beta hydrolase family protein [Rhodococcus sp. D2-41]MDG3010447.1 esterase family protein [Rhodococcus sp. D2-41]
MREGNARSFGKWRRRALGLGAALISLMTFLGLVGAGTASAWSPTHGRLETPCVWSAAMNRCIRVQIQFAAHGGNKYLMMLDGLRARDDFNGWDIETNAFQQFSNDNINIVMPVGGQSSFYTDWYAPSNFNGQTYTYKWETFLTQELPNYLAGRGMSRTGNGVVGLSMGGSAALDLAAHHRNQFNFAGSFSGYLNISAPGMPEAIRVAMLDAGGYNVDSMWGPPWDPAWLRNDPFVFAPQLRGLSLYISAASGLPTPGRDNPQTLLDYYNTANGMGLEALSLVNTRAFQVRLAALRIPATFDFPATGIHAWDNWEAQLWKARPQILSALGA